MTQVSIKKGNVTFTFTDGMIDGVSTSISSEIFETIMPGGGPGSNVGNDFSGTAKVITVNGLLLTATSSVTTGTGAPTITSIKQMKYWLESLMDGVQSVKTFTSNFEEYSVEAASASCTVNGVVGTIDGQSIPAAWTTTKVYVKELTFNEEAANPDSMPFTMTMWVAGA